MSVFLDRFRLDDRVILITGATSGVGRGIALACAESGATVVAIGRNPQKLESLYSQLKAISDKPHCCEPFDVTDFEKIPTFVAKIVDKCGKIGGYVHSAGVAKTIPIRMMDAKIYHDVFDVNIIAGYEFIKELSNRKNVAENASYLFIASISAIKGEAGLLAYSSSKGALLAGIKSMAVELSGKHIRVNALIPAHMVDTEMGTATLRDLPAEAVERLEQKHLLGFGKVDDITGPAVFLLSTASKWITGSALIVDGGYTL